MADERRVRECERLLENLRAAQDQLGAEQRNLLRLEEAVRLTEGEISAATNMLQRIADQIAEAADSAIGCARGDRRDCVAFAVSLANQQARQEE